MKKKMIITAICVVAAFIFLFPFGITKYDDGGTVSYKSMTYEIIRWNRMYGVYDEATGAGTSYWVHDTDFYIFPFNLRDNVADKEWSSEQLKFVKKMSELDNLEQTDAPTTTQVTSMPEETEPIPDCAMPIEPTEYFDAELEFSISPETLTINDSEDGFYIDVTTKIASGGLGYWGSSTVLGADVRVVLHNSGGTTLE